MKNSVQFQIWQQRSTKGRHTTHTHKKLASIFWGGGVSLCLPSAKHAEKEQSLRSVTFILNTWCDEKCISTGLSDGLSTWVSNLTTRNHRLFFFIKVSGRQPLKILFSFSVLRPNPGLSWWGNAASADLDYMLSSLLCPQNSLLLVALFINSEIPIDSHCCCIVPSVDGVKLQSAFADIICESRWSHFCLLSHLKQLSESHKCKFYTSQIIGWCFITRLTLNVLDSHPIESFI